MHTLLPPGVLIRDPLGYNRSVLPQYWRDFYQESLYQRDRLLMISGLFSLCRPCIEIPFDQIFYMDIYFQSKRQLLSDYEPKVTIQ